MSFDDSGFKDLLQRLGEVQGEQKVPVAEMFTSEFMTTNTPYESLEQMFEEAGITIDEDDVTERLIEDEDWNDFVQRTTQFDSWEDMVQKAGFEYIKRKIGFGD